MKPEETLGMIEEAAGTRMYETKKMAALKTIEKKQVRGGAIEMLNEEITLTLSGQAAWEKRVSGLGKPTTWSSSAWIVCARQSTIKSAETKLQRSKEEKNGMTDRLQEIKQIEVDTKNTIKDCNKQIESPTGTAREGCRWRAA